MMQQPTNDIALAVQILRDGGLVAFATETVYGLGADATNSLAVKKIFTAKGRPSTNPLIVHVAQEQIARRFAAAWPETAVRLAARFWPGPLTLVLPKSPAIVTEVTAGGDTVGLRVPNHPLAIELLRSFGGAVAAPSANRANHISPTSAADVRAELGSRVDLILDGGSCDVGIESTVIDLTPARPRILRPGGVSREQIEQVIGDVDLFAGSVDPRTPAMSPGQQFRHYSPMSPAFWFDRASRSHVMQGLNGVALLLGASGGSAGKVVEMPENPIVYARELYHTLRVIDERHPAAIYIEMPPDEPRWAAVRDRLMRACAHWETESHE
jgi:L-threonylcarbamoyladenylate synthase